MDESKYLVLLIGLSGSGKSKFVKQHLASFEAISLDAIRKELCGCRKDQSRNAEVVELAFRRLEIVLQAEQSVVWDATSLKIDYRRRIVSIASALDVNVVFIEFRIPFDELIERDRIRKHPVGVSVLQRQADEVQWPTCDEHDRRLVLNAAKRVVDMYGFDDRALPFGLERAKSTASVI